METYLGRTREELPAPPVHPDLAALQGLADLSAAGPATPDLDSWAHGIRVHGDAWPPDWRPEPAVR